LPADDPCLRLDRVSRVFGGLTAVDGVSLAVRAGERRALIGPNGAGTTTLFNVISGEVAATSGRLTLAGRDITRLSAARRAALGIARTFQIVRLFPRLTVIENLMLACAALDRRKFTMLTPLASSGFDARAHDLLEQFALGPFRDAMAASLSYGDQRKLEVALSMAGRPRLLLLDEPMAGLAAGERDAIQGLLDRLDPSVAVLLIEHDMDVALAFAERVTVMYQGRVLVEGDPRDIAANQQVRQIYLGIQQ
jgi:branched-chain amino acid transport system ATP-binding protein